MNSFNAWIFNASSWFHQYAVLSDDNRVIFDANIIDTVLHAMTINGDRHLIVLVLDGLWIIHNSGNLTELSDINLEIVQSACLSIIWTIDEYLSRYNASEDNDFEFDDNQIGFLEQEIERREFDCDMDEAGEECLICTEGGSVQKCVKLSCKCKNLYHSACILRWLERNESCPTCRSTELFTGE